MNNKSITRAGIPEETFEECLNYHYNKLIK